MLNKEIKSECTDIVKYYECTDIEKYHERTDIVKYPK